MRRLAVLLAVLAFPAGADAALVAEYHLDSTYADSSGNAFHGVNGEGAFVAGRWGSAFASSASTHGFDVLSRPELEPKNAVTLSVWVRRDGRAGSERIIVGKLNNGCGGVTYGFGTTEEESSPFFTVDLAGPTGAGAGDRTVDVWDGQWHALAGTYDGTTARLYVDGVLRKATSGPPGTLDYSGTQTDRRLQAGRHSLPGLPACNPADHSYRGELDDLRVYDTALSAAQIARIHDRTAATPPTADPTPSPSPVPSATPRPTPTPAPPPTAPPAVRNTALPAITKTARVDARTTRFTCSPGTWTGLAPAPGFQFTWLNEGRAVASGPTLDVGPSGTGLQYVCRVSALAATGQRVTADSVPQVLFSSFTVAAQPVAQEVVGDVRIRGIDVFQTVQPSAGAQQVGPGLGPFAMCGGGTPTTYVLGLACLLPAGNPQQARYSGLTLDEDKPAYATVYVSRAAASTATLVYVDVEGSIPGGPSFRTVMETAITPVDTPVDGLVRPAERDQEAFAATVPIPQGWLVEAWDSGARRLNLNATVTLEPSDQERVQCVVFNDLCELNDRFALTDIPVEGEYYLLDVGTLELRTPDQMNGGANPQAMAGPDFVLGEAVRLFPGGNRMRVHDYATTLQIDVDRAPCPPGFFGETPQARSDRLRGCRSDLVFSVMQRWMRQTPDNQRGYDVLMGVHDYGREPGVQTGRPLTPSTTAGNQPIFHADDGGLGRPITAAAHELGHALGLPHADRQCGGNDPLAGGGQAWPPDDRGRLQGVAFDSSTWNRDVDGVAANLYDLMSYCRDLPGIEVNHWLSPYNWNRLAQNLLALSNQRPDLFRSARSSRRSGPDTGFVTGTLTGGGAAITGIVPPGTGALPVAGDPASPVRVRATDAAGGVLGEAGAQISASSEVPGSATFIAPIPAGTDAVAVLANGAVLDQRRRSRPPVVRVVAPRRGARVRRALTVRWTAKDPDGDPLEAAVQAADGTTGWRTVWAGTGDRAVVPGDRLPAGRRARVRVVVNDGFDQAQAVSAPFRSAGPPPEVHIVAPAPGARLPGTGTVRLEGTATDAAGRTLRGRALTWFAGKRRLGTGNPLSVRVPAGAARIRLVARDRSGRRGSLTRTVRVEPVPLRLTRLSAPARVKAGARRVRVAVAVNRGARLRIGGRTVRVGPRRRTVAVRLPKRPRHGVLELPVRLTARGERPVVSTLRVVRL